MKNNNEQTGNSNVNYGIMETKVCRGSGKSLPLSEFYFDRVNNRYESYSKEYKQGLVKKRRQEDETYKLRQEVYNLRYQLKKLKESK